MTPTTELFEQLKTEDDYRTYCLEHYPKYKFQIDKMSLTELKNMIFSHEYPNTNFEGIATIISACNQKDFNKLISYINDISLEPPNIIRILMDTLDNVSYYKDKFYFELVKFKNSYETKLRGLLFDIGIRLYIDKLDLINMFKKLIK